MSTNINGKICISQEDWDKIITYAQMSYNKYKSEIGGMLVAFTDKKNRQITIKNPVIGKQEVSGGNCTLDKEWLADYYCEMAMKHGVDVKFVWWHSHHTMGAFWSGTDLSAINEFSNGKYSMSLVINLKHEYKFRVNWWEPTHGYIDTNIEIIKPTYAITKEMQADFDKLISKEKTIQTTLWKEKNNIKNKYDGYANDYFLKYKQPGNEFGPGVIDRELMDRSDTLQEKYCDILDKLIEQAYQDNWKWTKFAMKWSKVINNAMIDDIVIEEMTIEEFSLIKEGTMLNAVDYFESPEPSLNLARPSNEIQEYLF